MDILRQAEILKEPRYDLGMGLLGNDQRNASTQSIAMDNHYSRKDYSSISNRRYIADIRKDGWIHCVEISTFLQSCFGDSFS
jgi:hypothetical protein